MREVADVHDANAERVVLVPENFNTRVAVALCDALPAAEARRLWQKLEVHYTAKHGSWLKMAEIDLSVLAG